MLRVGECRAHLLVLQRELVDDADEGMCVDLCSEVFSLDGDGFVVANMTEIPEELMEAAEEAVYCCPEDVMKITKSER